MLSRRPRAPEIERRLLVASTDARLGLYRGGIYNPGAAAVDEGIVLLARNERYTEIDRGRHLHLWPGSCRPVAIEVDRDAHVRDCYPLLVDSSNRGERFEDFRLFFEGDTLFANFHRVVAPDWIEPHVAEFDLQTRRLGPPRLPNVDFPVGRVEKNWCYFQSGSRIILLYSFCPFRLLERESTLPLHFVTRIADRIPTSVEPHEMERVERISLSTNPIDFDEKHILFFVHWRDGHGNYRHYGTLLDKATLMPIRLARRPLFAGGRAIGLRPRVVYLMSVVRQGETFWFFLGEGDEHISFAQLAEGELRAYLADSVKLDLVMSPRANTITERWEPPVGKSD